MRKLITVIAIICVLITAGAVLWFTGVIKIGSKADEETVSSKSVAAMEYMGSYVILDNQAVVTATLEELPENIPVITGLEITTMISGEEIHVENAEGLSYALEVVKNLRTVGIDDIEEIFVSSDNDVTLYVKDVKILLGQNVQTSKKLEDLKNFYSQVLEYSGTLDMQEADTSNKGYTFKKSE